MITNSVGNPNRFGVRTNANVPVLMQQYAAMTQPGAQGEKGEQGQRGEKGEQGQRGEQGDKGERGEQGDKGERGEQGDKGERGEQGDKGERGEQGQKGERGEQGIQGDKGERGEQGIQGDKGDSQFSLDEEDNTVFTNLTTKIGDITLHNNGEVYCKSINIEQNYFMFNNEINNDSSICLSDIIENLTYRRGICKLKLLVCENESGHNYLEDDIVCTITDGDITGVSSKYNFDGLTISWNNILRETETARMFFEVYLL
jgi:hypothetical protein